MFNFFKPATYATGQYPQPNLSAMKLAAHIAAARAKAHPAILSPPNLQQSSGHLTQSGWHIAWATRVGSTHIAQDKPCEDAVAHKFHHLTHTKTEGLSIALADGISGGALGQVAAQTSVEFCTTYFAANTNDAALAQHLSAIDQTVSHAIAQHTTRIGATTLACAWLQPDGQGQLAHIGDVRAYKWVPESAENLADNASRHPILGHLQPLTIDQTYTNLGETPPANIPADNPAHMAGNGSAGAPSIQTIHILEGETLMLCSDGIHGFLSDAQLAHTLTKSSKNTSQLLTNTATALLNFALENGSDDDLSVLLATRIAP